MFLSLVLIMMSSTFAMAQEKYGFKVAGVDVTGDNCLDLTEISGVSGKVSFDPNTRTLTLDNATIEIDGYNAILNQTCKDFVIELLGTNTFNVTNSAGIYLCESTTIMGGSGSKLTIENDRCAVLFESVPLEIVNCWLEVEGEWGISANDSVAEEVLTIRNSYIEATGPTGSICDIADLKLEGCHIDIPSKAAYDAETRSVAVNGETVTSKVVIEPDSYGIYIDGSLHLTSKRFCGLDMESASVTIDNTSLFVKGGYGIAGFIGAKSEVLTVRNSYVEAEGSGSGSISLISDLILDNCAIKQPVGAEFDADQKAVVLNGEVLKSKVVIEPVTNSIGTVTADVPACKQGIYNLNGVKLTTPWNDLPAGIYIVDGVKRVKI